MITFGTKSRNKIRRPCGVSIATLLICTLTLTFAVTAQASRPGMGAQPYNEHTPSYDAMIKAKRSYDAGRYFSALASYKSASRWADKFAQFNVGVMYLQGQGTEADPARAWAWFELAAERNYPDLVSAADNVWETLTPEQQNEAKAILESELAPRYKDEIAIERTTRRMERDRRKATGSRLGTAGALTIVDRSGQVREGAEYYAEEKWDFRNIISYETELVFAISRGRVELGDLNLVDDEPEENEDE